MDWLNYHHLLYFYLVAREGTISAASEVLRLAPSTISVQIKTLEEALGEDLFERSGRNLVLTERGKLAYSYAEEIFGLGQELLDTFRSQPVGRPYRLRVGIADVLWKDIGHQLIQPAMDLDHPVRLTCLEGDFDELLAQLAVHNVDVVLADAPIGPSVSVKGFNHLLGQSGVTFFANEDLAGRYRRDFPASLEGAPMLLPSEKTALRRHLEQWFDSEGVRPNMIGEFDDSALMTSFGARGVGIFPAPSVVEIDISRQYGLEAIGTPEKVKQQFYAVTVDRKIKHPAVQAICEVARQSVFR